MKHVRALLTLLLCFASSSSFAVSYAPSSENGLLRPLAGGLVFPSLYTAVQNSPAGLLHDSKTVVGIDWSAPFGNASAATLSEGFAAGGKFFAGGIIAGGSASGSTVTFDRVTAAMAVGSPGTSLGVNASYVASQPGVDIDIGLAVDNVSGIHIAALLTSVQTFQTNGAFNFGVGYSEPKNFQIEGSWSYALFAATENHILSLNSVIYQGIFGIGASVTYATGDIGNALTFGAGLSASFSSRFTFAIHTRYSIAQGTIGSLSLNVAF